MSDLIPEYPGDAINELVENSPRFRKAANAVGPGIVGAIATVASGNGAVGKGAELAAKAASSASPNTFAKVVAHVGFCAGTVAVTVLATPLFVIAFPVLVVASLFADDK